MQLDMFQHSKNLRDQGIKQSVDHANQVHDDWKSKAYNFLLKYIAKHKKFMAEDVRKAFEEAHLPAPPSNRAWGAIILMASRSNLIKRIGYKPVKNPKAHLTPATEWEVLV